jgi:transposase InsO family protein
MGTILRPVHALALMLAGWLSRQQAAAIEYHRAVNMLLLARLKGRLTLTDQERTKLAVLDMAMGRNLLKENSFIVKPETILRWHRNLVAAKWTYKAKSNPNRVGLMKTIRALAVKFAIENPSWGYDRIQEALKNIGHVVCPNTVKSALKHAGIDPAPQRGQRTRWSTFIKAHAASIAATDFFTTEVWTAQGLVTHYTLFVIDLATRAVQIVGTTPNPDEHFMKQVARLLTDPVDGFLRRKKFLIMDRDSIFSEAFRGELRENGIRALRTPASSPNCNAYAERFVGTIRREVTNRMIFFGPDSLRRAFHEHALHYGSERNHQGIGNNLVAPEGPIGSTQGKMRCRSRLGGMFNYYYREVA